MGTRRLPQGAKRGVYTEYLRSISASYVQATSGQRERSEDAGLLATTAEIEILSGQHVARQARDLTNAVLDVHSRIAERTAVAEAAVEAVNQRRYEVIDLFKADLGIKERA
ncbi:hypothetical protein ABZT04_03345 [Streptomyces sp. NPDC005492]|uniref:hypothetical protein n=1 Tax=Streptomyces sp. NPDC005492 TaxID=3156883 RepID=UPI0033A614B8